MTCDEDRVIAFVNGELSDADENAFDQHLLSCESCWRAIREDRAGRLALDQLYVPAPAGLRDRVTFSIDLAGKRPVVSDTPPSLRAHALRHSGRARPRAPRRLVLAAALVVAVLSSSLGWVFLHGRPAGDPPQIAAVVAMMSPGVASSVALRSGEQFDLGGQSLTVRSYEVEGTVVLVATSTQPFPVPASAHLLAGSSPAAWTGTHGALAMYGVNRPVGDDRESMFLVTQMPMAQLPRVARRAST